MSANPTSMLPGTSLPVIARRSCAGYAGRAGHVVVDLPLFGVVSASAVVGSVMGGRLANLAHPDNLRRGFAGCVLLMALFVLGKELLPADSLVSIGEVQIVR